MDVTFTPSAAGTRTATLTVTDNAGNVAGSTQTVVSRQAPLGGTKGEFAIPEFRATGLAAG